MHFCSIAEFGYSKFSRTNLHTGTDHQAQKADGQCTLLVAGAHVLATFDIGYGVSNTLIMCIGEVRDANYRSITCTSVLPRSAVQVVLLVATICSGTAFHRESWKPIKTRSLRPENNERLIV